MTVTLLRPVALDTYHALLVAAKGFTSLPFDVYLRVAVCSLDGRVTSAGPIPPTGLDGTM